MTLDELRAKHPTIFIGKLYAVALQDRQSQEGDRHQLFVIYVEDDGNWFLKLDASSHWFDDLIGQLIAARDFMQQNYTPEPHGYGFKR